MINNKIFGLKNQLSSKDRFFNLICMIVFIISLLSFLRGIALSGNMKPYLFEGFISIYFGVLYILGRRNLISRKVVIPIIVVGTAISFWSWNFFYGNVGMSKLFIFCTIPILPWVIKGLKKTEAMLVIFLFLTFLTALEINKIIDLANDKELKIDLSDTLGSLIYFIFLQTIVIVFIIVSYRRKQKKLKSIIQSKDKFFSIVSHDLRGIVGNVVQLSEVIKESKYNLYKNNQEELIDEIHVCSQKSIDLLDNILQWAHSKSGLLKLKPTHVSLNEVAEYNYRLLFEEIKSKQITSQLKLSGNPIVFADKDMLHTVVRNLMSNAIKFTPNQGHIEVSTVVDNRGKRAKLMVSDNGVGIKEEVIPKLFGIDSDYSTLGTNNEKGTAIGLKLCKEFVDRNKGTISVKSTVGKGSIFIIAFKLNKKPKG